MNRRGIEPGDRVLVVRPGALGDTILTLPAIRALRRTVGTGGRIELVGYPTPLQLAVNPRHADCAHSIDRTVFAGLFSGSSSASAELDGFLASYDWVIAWCRDETGRLKERLERLGVAHHQSAPFPSEGSGVHVSDNLIRTLEPLGVSGPANQPELVLSDEDVAVGLELILSVSLRSRAFLAIHPGSGSDRKNWSAEHFAELAALARQSGLGVLIIEGEADREAVRRVRAGLTWKPPVFENLSLSVLASVLSRAAAYVGNDSGITHLAAAARAPTWALFGATNPSVWAPKGAMVHIRRFEETPQMVWQSIQTDMGRGRDRTRRTSS